MALTDTLHETASVPDARARLRGEFSLAQVVEPVTLVGQDHHDRS